MLERRRPIMQDWADFLSEQTAAKVVSIGSQRQRP
jgi:hypothetical protein